MIEDPALREVELGGPDTTTPKRICCGVSLFEVETDAHCLSPLPLWQAHIDAVDGLSVDHHPKLRRWIGEETTIPDDEAFLPLENGVEVHFQGTHFRSGQHWLVPARTQTRDVEWTTEPNDGGELEPLAQPPLGVHHAYAKLAIVDLTDTGFEVVSDCRLLFPVLAQPALRNERILRASDDLALALNSQIRPNNLSAGLIFEFNAPVLTAALALTEEAKVSLHGAIEVVLDLPDPLEPEDREFWGFARTFGFRPLTVAATVTSLDDPARLLWRPVSQTQVFLGRLFTRLNTSGNQDEVNRVRARLQIRGQALWADGSDGRRTDRRGRSGPDQPRRWRRRWGRRQCHRPGKLEPARDQWNRTHSGRGTRTQWHHDSRGLCGPVRNRLGDDAARRLGK